MIERVRTLLKSMPDASKVDFRNPENFFHDVNSVAGLLKQFFRDLPDPLLTTEHYAEFIDAARTLHPRSTPLPLVVFSHVLIRLT